MVRPGQHLAEARRLLDEERRHLLVDARALGDVGVGADQDRDQRGRAAVGQPHLLAGERVAAVGVRHGLGGDRRDVGPAVRLGHRERPAHLARGHPRQVLGLLLVGAVLHEHVRDDEVRVHDAADAHPAARDLLDAQGVGQQRLAEAAVLLGDHQAEDPHLLHALDDRGRVLVGVLEVLGDRDDLVVHELPDRREDLLLHLGQALSLRQAWHGSSSIDGCFVTGQYPPRHGRSARRGHWRAGGAAAPRSAAPCHHECAAPTVTGCARA